MQHFVYCVLPEWVCLTLRPTTFSVCEVAQILWHHLCLWGFVHGSALTKRQKLASPKAVSYKLSLLIESVPAGPSCILSFSPSSPFCRVPPQPQFSRHLCLGTVFYTKLIHPHCKLRTRWTDIQVYKYFLLLSHAIRNFNSILFCLDSSYPYLQSSFTVFSMKSFFLERTLLSPIIHAFSQFGVFCFTVFLGIKYT